MHLLRCLSVLLPWRSYWRGAGEGLRASGCYLIRGYVVFLDCVAFIMFISLKLWSFIYFLITNTFHTKFGDRVCMCVCVCFNGDPPNCEFKVAQSLDLHLDPSLTQ